MTHREPVGPFVHFADGIGELLHEVTFYPHVVRWMVANQKSNGHPNVVCHLVLVLHGFHHFILQVLDRVEELLGL